MTYYSFLGAASLNGWIIIQTLSTKPSISWNRTWSDYVNGFGSLDSGNFWLGLEAMYRMTGVSPSRLMVQTTEAGTGALSVVTFAKFSIGDASTKYRLLWSSMTGDVYFQSTNLNGFDILSYHNGQPFATYDNDPSVRQCANMWIGGWWYNDCRALITTSMSPCSYMGASGVYTLLQTGISRLCSTKALMSIMFP
jgi:ficolin